MRIPCEKNCPGRTGTCHADCEKYREYREFCQKVREQRLREQHVNDYTAKAVTESKRRRRK